MTDDLIRGSGNVFRDLGEPDADRKHARATFAAALIGEMNRLGLDDAAIRDLRNLRRLNNLSRFSDDRLIELQHLLSGLEAKTMTETVTVPRELLREVFETADMHANHAWVLLRLREAYTCAEGVRRSRARIAELRKAAGLEE